MSQVTFPNFSGQPGMKFDVMTITGASVSSSEQSSDGLDKRGKFTATCKSNGSNQYTVKWLSSYADAAYVIPIPIGDNVGVNIISQDETGFVYTTCERDDNTATLTTAVVAFVIVGFNTAAAFK